MSRNLISNSIDLGVCLSSLINYCLDCSASFSWAIRWVFIVKIGSIVDSYFFRGQFYRNGFLLREWCRLFGFLPCWFCSNGFFVVFIFTLCQKVDCLTRAIFIDKKRMEFKKVWIWEMIKNYERGSLNFQLLFFIFENKDIMNIFVLELIK